MLCDSTLNCTAVLAQFVVTIAALSYCLPSSLFHTLHAWCGRSWCVLPCFVTRRYNGTNTD